MNLEPLRAELLSRTGDEGARQLEEVDHTCELQIASARATAEAMTARSRAAGERAAAREARRRLGAASRRARELELAVERTLVEELRARTLAAALDLRGDSRYRELLQRLARRARDQIGPKAEIEVDPPGLGGVRARAGDISVDYTLPALVERALTDLGEGLEELWR